MKKIIGILGVAVIAVTMFFSANNVNGSSTDINLASLINLNVAHADGEVPINGTDCVCKETNCQDANWISFRTHCGSVSGTPTDESCALNYAQHGWNSCNN